MVAFGAMKLGSMRAALALCCLLALASKGSADSEAAGLRKAWDCFFAKAKAQAQDASPKGMGSLFLACLQSQQVHHPLIPPWLLQEAEAWRLL